MREHSCPFCRDVPATSNQIQKMTKRIQANDPFALYYMGMMRYQEGNYAETLQYLTKAAELGDATAHYNLSCMYRDGQGVEKDEKKQVYHLEDPEARAGLSQYETNKARFDRAVKHCIIAANLGHNKAIQVLKGYYKEGLVSKEDFAAALRAFQAAVDATKSPQRDAA